MYISEFRVENDEVIAKVSLREHLNPIAKIIIRKDEQIKEEFTKVEIRDANYRVLLGTILIKFEDKCGIPTKAIEKFAKETLIDHIKNDTKYTEILISYEQYTNIKEISRIYRVSNEQIVHKLIEYGIRDYNKYGFCNNSTGGVGIKVVLPLDIEKLLNQAIADVEIPNQRNAVIKTIIGYGFIRYDQSKSKINFLTK